MRFMLFVKGNEVTEGGAIDALTATLLQRLRKFCKTPVIVWCDELSDLTSRKLLAFKNTYTLRTSDGLISLSEVLHRIEMKTTNPALWVRLASSFSSGLFILVGKW